SAWPAHSEARRTAPARPREPPDAADRAGRPARGAAREPCKRTGRGRQHDQAGDGRGALAAVTRSRRAEHEREERHDGSPAIAPDRAMTARSVPRYDATTCGSLTTCSTGPRAITRPSSMARIPSEL